MLVKLGYSSSRVGVGIHKLSIALGKASAGLALILAVSWPVLQLSRVKGSVTALHFPLAGYELPRVAWGSGQRTSPQGIRLPARS